MSVINDYDMIMIIVNVIIKVMLKFLDLYKKDKSSLVLDEWINMLNILCTEFFSTLVK